MSRAANRIVQKLWSYCNVLRDDGLSYHDYLEQLAFLLFLENHHELHRDQKIENVPSLEATAQVRLAAADSVLLNLVAQRVAAYRE